MQCNAIFNHSKTGRLTGLPINDVSPGLMCVLEEQFEDTRYLCRLLTPINQNISISWVSKRLQAKGPAPRCGG